jgi:hypothetical protein
MSRTTRWNRYVEVRQVSSRLRYMEQRNVRSFIQRLLTKLSASIVVVLSDRVAEHSVQMIKICTSSGQTIGPRASLPKRVATNSRDLASEARRGDTRCLQERDVDQTDVVQGSSAGERGATERSWNIGMRSDTRKLFSPAGTMVPWKCQLSSIHGTW